MGGVERRVEVALHNPAVMNAISADGALSPLPHNLFHFWQECIERIGGRKPVSFLCFSDRGCRLFIQAKLNRFGFSLLPVCGEYVDNQYRLINF
jgi:hypothetical protein